MPITLPLRGSSTAERETDTTNPAINPHSSPTAEEKRIRAEKECETYSITIRKTNEIIPPIPEAIAA